ncbi:3-oxoacyl-reductase 4 [Podospora aff. communis PSN243]|uniref:3-oxoacyl-reductase 4 n=1 Tax=Podospora aff. communis PSN243 TaxID=3040156 RepID=A0AAV9GUH3_9PEZI|nr:3-oxoacyl-reductase 4 [Podospora aff. communis PSN243]
MSAFPTRHRDFPANTPGSYWTDFIQTQPPQYIVKQLLQDAATLDAGGNPSQLAAHLPVPSSNLALKIGDHLTPSPDIPEELKRFLYQTIRTRLRNAIENGALTQEPPLPEDGYLLPGDLTTTVPLPTGPRKPAITEPTQAEAETTLRVLRYLTLDARIHPEHLHQSIATLAARFGLTSPSESQSTQEPPTPSTTPLTPRWASTVTQYYAHKPPSRLRTCYICRCLLIDPHPRYRSMCHPCGSFNYAGSSLSLPDSLNLAGRTALVTGARVNLGYATALRLLRCGATVIATSRYPHDAAVRYSQEGDFAEWRGRLRVVGADFRSARDAFGLVACVRGVLREVMGAGAERLDVLVNNAAQTLTDSVKKEERAVGREAGLGREARATGVIVEESKTGYTPRVRGGAAPLAVAFYGGEQEKAVVSKEGEGSVAEDVVLPDNVKDVGRTEVQQYFKSSWVQTISEIPYEDIISAHAVNTFVPLILFRELLTLMGAAMKPTSEDSSKGEDKPRRSRQKKKPLGYIINVSSREGIFENTPDHAAKKGAHVHTNMTKAALHMITQTEAATAWQTRAVAMNTVDPGYMSAAPEMDGKFGGIRPLDWEDGAGRVIWPVAIGEVEGDPVWGRFLKHYGAVDVDLKRF